MAHIDDGGNKGRSSNVDVNIVPFIDLMSVLVIFLLITAVWTQVSMIQIGSSIYGKKGGPEPEIKDEVQIPLRMDIRANGYFLIMDKERKRIGKINGQYDTKTAINELSRFKKVYPEKTDAVITMEDDLKYEALILGMDVLLEADFPEIAVATSGAQ